VFIKVAFNGLYLTGNGIFMLVAPLAWYDVVRPAPPKMERRLVAIIAADAVGYSRLMEHDEAGMFQRLRAHYQEVAFNQRLTVAGLESDATCLTPDIPSDPASGLPWPDCF
jgi:hypothetical protein